MGARWKTTRVSDFWFVYLLECSDGSYYCGIAKDVASRVAVHKAGKGSKYVASRLPIRDVVAVSPPFRTRSRASIIEAKVKGLSRDKKVAAVTEPSILEG